MNIVKLSLFSLQIMFVVPLFCLATEPQPQCDNEILGNPQELIFEIDGVNTIINDPCLEQDQTEIDDEQIIDEFHEEDDEDAEQEDGEVDLGDEDIALIDYEEQEELLVSPADVLPLQQQSDTPTVVQLAEQQEVVNLPVMPGESEEQPTIEQEKSVCDSCVLEQEMVVANEADSRSYDLMDYIHMLLAKVKALLFHN